MATAAGLTPLMLAARCGGAGGAGVARLLIQRCRGDAHKRAALVNAKALVGLYKL
jgi:hypothetical protein